MGGSFLGVEYQQRDSTKKDPAIPTSQATAGALMPQVERHVRWQGAVISLKASTSSFESLRKGNHGMNQHHLHN